METVVEEREEGGKAGEDDGFRGGGGRAEFVQLGAESFDFGGATPGGVVNPRGDRLFSGVLLFQLEFGLGKVNGKDNVAGWAGGV